MASPFVFVDSASWTKEDIFENDKEYIPFLVNRAFSMHVDTILYANDINLYSFLDKKLQYHYYLYGVPKRRRYSKWLKPEKLENIEFIQQVFNCGESKAKEYIEVLDPDKLNSMKQEYSEIGRVNEFNR